MKVEMQSDVYRQLVETSDTTLMDIQLKTFFLLLIQLIALFVKNSDPREGQSI